MDCLQCDICRDRDYPREELSTEIWQEILRSLGSWAGSFLATISGGEPFIRDDIVTLFETLTEINVPFGVVTNGFIRDRSVVDAVASTGILFVAVSLDGASPETVDRLRGRDGAFERVTSTIARLAELRRRCGRRYKVIVKTTVMGANAAELLATVELARRLGADGIQFQPLEQPYKGKLLQDPDDSWHEKSALWPADMPAMTCTLDALVRSKRRESRPFILNSAANLSRYKSYFLDPLSGRLAGGACTIGTRALFVAPWGDVSLCPALGAIGNLREQSIEDLWRSEEAARHRRLIRACDRNCVSSCFQERSLREKAGLFWRLFG